MDKDTVQFQKEFKVGEKVRFTITGTPATVLGIERYRTKRGLVAFYKIKLQDGIRSARQNELEAIEGSPSL